jgi:agmatine/peptidylarginine deiminase
MKRPLLLLVAILLVVVPLGAEEMVIVPREILESIIDDNPGPPLPRYALPGELLAPPLELPDAVLTPPAGTVDCPPEYAPNEGLLIRWGDFNSVLTAMTVPITTGDPDGIVYILVSGASQQSSATATLTNAGADMSQVEFITVATNSVWIRDYGPRFISEDGHRAVIDHTYNRPRPLDNQIPDFIAALWGEPSYDIGLTHGGGNFHLFGDDEAFMTELIVNENPSLTPAEIEQRYLDYQGLDLTITDPLPSWFDSTQHIDMWMLPVSDREVIIGQYDPGSAAYTVTETWVTELLSRGYTVHRTPGWSSSGTHYTYTNAVVFNDIVFVPEFSGYPTENAQAVAVFQAAFPGKTIVPVDCTSIITLAGAIHCIVMHVPDVDPPFFADGFEDGTTGAWSGVTP